MLTKCDFINVDGVSTYSLNDVKSPLNTFDVQVANRTETGRNKMEQHGVNSTIASVRGGMEIHVEGSLFAETSSAYATERKALVKALFGDPNTPVTLTDRTNGTLTIRVDGETEDWEAYCAVTVFQAPMKGNFPALTDYLVTFFSWEPWFTGSSSGDKYYYA